MINSKIMEGGGDGGVEGWMGRQELHQPSDSQPSSQPAP